MITMRKWQAMHAEIEQLKAELQEAKQQATECRISLEDLEASLPKVGADAVLSILEPPSLAQSGDTYKQLIERHAKKILEQGNE